jgi:ATP-dependent RNA helicase RhlB
VYELPAIERYIGKKIPSEIAVAELHAEDKSAGQRIQTEFYEDRREERPPGRAPARPPKSRSGPRAPETGKVHPHGQGRSVPRGHGQDDKKGGNIRQGHRGLSGSPKGENRRRQNPSPDATQKTALLEASDLSRMSFDERMALYKKKYDSGTRTSDRREGPSGGGKAAGKAADKTAAETYNVPQQPEQSAPAPKSIFSRLLGKFKKQKPL